jgi:hypothetical protein
MIPLTVVLTLALAALVFVLSQHGWGNTLISIGTRIAHSGAKFNERTEARRKVVVREWARRLAEAEQ